MGTGKSTLAHNLPRLYQFAKSGKGDFTNFIDCDDKFDPVSLKSSMSLMPWNSVDWVVLDEIDKIKPDRLAPLHSILSDNQNHHPAILIANSIHKIPRGIRSRCHPLEIVAPRPADYLPFAMKRLFVAGKRMDESKVLKALEMTVCDQADIRAYERILKRLLV